MPELRAEHRHSGVRPHPQPLADAIASRAPLRKSSRGFGRIKSYAIVINYFEDKPVKGYWYLGVCFGHRDKFAPTLP